MGFLDKAIIGGGAAWLARSLFKDAQETKRRRNSPLCFEDGLTQTQFADLAQEIAKRTPRVREASVSGMTVSLRVGSNSGLSVWKVEIDFNDYGHLTGTYWISSDNSQSVIPGHFADQLRTAIQERVGPRPANHP